MANVKKKDVLEDITSFFGKYTNFALVKFDRTSHTKLEDLRKNLKKQGAKVKVVKNTILEKSVNKLSNKDSQFADLRKKMFPLKENSALVGLGEDWSAALKSFYTFIQGEKTLSFKAGRLDKTVYMAGDMDKIAQLPPKGELVAKVLGSFKSPSARLVHSMKFNLTKLAYVLSAKAKQG